MHIVLFRHGTRALFLRAGQQLTDCPPDVRLWLGGPVTEDHTTLTLDTPMPGIQPSAVMQEILTNGFCALDEYGVVRGFGFQSDRRPQRSAALRIRYQTERNRLGSHMAKP